MTYDYSKDTTLGDVQHELGDVVEATKALANGGTVAKVVDEAAEAAQAAFDLLRDNVEKALAEGKRFFRAKTGCSLHDPDQDVHVQPHADTPGVVTPWVEARVAEGLVEDVTEKLAGSVGLTLPE